MTAPSFRSVRKAKETEAGMPTMVKFILHELLSRAR